MTADNVVRRDGLREAVTKLRDEWAADEGRTWISNCGDELSRVLDAVPDVPPTEDDWREANRYYDDDPGLLPDVPPDPPAADRQELARVLAEHVYEAYRLGRYGEQEHLPMWHKCDPKPNLAETQQAADALLSSGVLVDAADVRAREADAIAHAIREAAKKPPHILADNAQRVWMAGMDRAQKIAAGIAAGIRMGVDRAVSEREGRTT